MINKLIDNCECCYCKEKEEILKELLNVKIPKYPNNTAVYLKEDFIKNKSRKDITTYYVNNYFIPKELYTICNQILGSYTRTTEVKIINNLKEEDLVLRVLSNFYKGQLVTLKINNHVWEIKEVIEENINVYKYKIIDVKQNISILVDGEDIIIYKPVEEYVKKKESILQKIFRILD